MMKTTILNITLSAFVAVGMISCKDNNKENENMAEEVSEPTEMAMTYNVDAAASQIMWEGAKPTGTHNGTIGLASGTISVNNEMVEAGNFIIDMKSIQDLDLEGDQKANLEAHLMGTVEGKEGDFFNVNEFPTAKFEMTGMEDMDGKTMVQGNLTIKDKTNNISFPATVNMEADKVTITSEKFEIDRTKWGVNYGSKSVFDNLGDKFVNDAIVLTIKVVANKA